MNRNTNTNSNPNSGKTNQNHASEVPQMQKQPQSSESQGTQEPQGTAESRLTRRISVAIAVLFVTVLTVCGVLVFALPSKLYSENENRNLAQFPPLVEKDTTVEGEDNEGKSKWERAWDHVLSGEWQKHLAEFLTDQFPARDLFTASASAMTRLIGIRDVGGAYIGKDGYYFEMTTEQQFERARYRNNLLQIAKFAETHPSLPVTVLLAPDAGIILPEKLPAFAELYDAEKCYEEAKRLLAGCTLIDVRETLTAEKQTAQLYYRTDHHWTTYGAYLAYTQFCAVRGMTAESYAGFDPVVVTEDFLGTLYSKVLDPSAIPDKVEIPEVPDTLTVTADGKEISLYSEEALEGKDKYQVFFGGNYGQVVIRNSAVTNGKVLLVIKDSYANSFVPFLTGEYETVVMLDFRYFGGSVSDVIAKERVTEVLVLYELSGFASDRNLLKLQK